MAYVFDFQNTLIEITSPQTDVDIQDLINEIRTAESTNEGIAYPKIANASGKESLSAGVNVGITVELQNGWQLHFWVGAYTASITGGNLVGGPAGDPIAYSADVQVVLVQSANATIVSSGSGLSTEEHDELFAIADTVWDEDLTVHDLDKTSGAVQQATKYDKFIVIDSVNGVAGIAWNIGTHENPVNNLTDALTIAAARGIDNLRLHTDLVVTAAHDVSGMLIDTHGKMGIEVTFESGCSADNTALRYVNILGTLTNGDILLVEACSIGTLSNFSGIMNNVAFADGAEIGMGVWATLIQATAGGAPTNEPELNIGTALVNISQYTGNLKLINKTGSNRTVINCTSGNILIDSTCTAGIIQLLGVGVVESDNSGAGCTVDTDGFIAIENIGDAVWDETLSEHTGAGSTGYTLDAVQTAIVNVLGLTGENVRWSGLAFDTNDNLISAVITLYTDNTLITSIKAWQLTATYDTNSRLTAYEMKEY